MNRVFKVVWNKSMNRWDVTSEIGSSRKKAKRSTMSKVAVSVIAGALALGGVAMADTIPTPPMQEAPPVLTPEEMEGPPVIDNPPVETPPVEDLPKPPTAKEIVASTDTFEKGNHESDVVIITRSMDYATNNSGNNKLATKQDIAGLQFIDTGELTFTGYAVAGQQLDITIGDVAGYGEPINLTIDGNAEVTDTAAGNLKADQSSLKNQVTIKNSIDDLNDQSKININGFNKVTLNNVTTAGQITLAQINELNMGELNSSNLNIEDVRKANIEALSLIGGNSVGIISVSEDAPISSKVEIGKIDIVGGELEISGNNEDLLSDHTVYVKTRNVSVADSGLLTIGNHTNFIAQDIKVSGEYSTLNIGNGMTPFADQGTSLSTQNITLNNGAHLNVFSAATTPNSEENIKTTSIGLIVEDTLTVGKDIPANMDTDVPTPSSQGDSSVLNLTDVAIVDSNNILDLTTINHLNIDGGKVIGLENSSVKINDVTFTSSTNGELKVNELAVEGKGNFSIVVDEGSDPLAPPNVSGDDYQPQYTQKEDAGLSVSNLDVLGQVKLTADYFDNSINIIKSQKAIFSSFNGSSDDIKVGNSGMLILDGNENFDFKANVVEGEVYKPILQFTEEAIDTNGPVQAILKIDSPVTVSGGAIGGNGYVANTLTLDRNADLYVGNAFTNKGLEGDAAKDATYGHFAVDNLVVTSGNIHFSLAEGGNEADRLTILESADGRAKVFVSPVMSATLTGDAQGNVLLIDASAVDSSNAKGFTATLVEPVSRGLYEYDLVKREGSVEDGALGTGAQWFLTSDWSEIEEQPTEPEVKPTEPEVKPTEPEVKPTEPEVKPTEPEAKPAVHKYAVEPNAYLANLITSNRMFALSYEDREYLADGSGLWTNVGGSFGKFKGNVTKDQIDSKVNYFTLRIGKDLVSTNEYTAGIMAAYGHASGHSDSNVTGRRADNKVDGFALGAYGTYYFDEAGYVDAWAQYVHTRNKVESDGRPTEKYNANGLLASIEVGNAFKLSDTVTVVPQGQITYMGVKAKDHRAIDGVQYGSNRGNVQFRLGATLFANGVMNGGTPYVGVNYFHNTSNNKVKIQDTLGGNHDLSLTGGKNLFQLKVGSDFKIDNHSRIGGEVSHTFGKDSYRDTKVDVNYRYDF